MNSPLTQQVFDVQPDLSENNYHFTTCSKITLNIAPISQITPSNISDPKSTGHITTTRIHMHTYMPMEERAFLISCISALIIGPTNIVAAIMPIMTYIIDISPSVMKDVPKDITDKKYCDCETGHPNIPMHLLIWINWDNYDHFNCSLENELNV